VTLFGTAARVTQPEGDDALAFLSRDRAWATYPLSYLEPGSGQSVHTWTCERDGRAESLVAVIQLPRLLSVFAMGEAAGIGTILAEMRPQPGAGVFSVREEVLGTLERHLHVTTSYRMVRMALRRGQLRQRRTASAVRLGMDGLEDARRLYGMWTDLNQLPAQLTGGVYFGVYDGAELVAIAGTHCLSRTHRTGVIGNVLTHASHRGQGLASTTTSAVAEELFRMGCEDVVLNVRSGNDAAWRCYQRLGFVSHCGFVEGVFHSRK
jgi:ribosomal protein S18 acetylase RimI-like enzyme